MKELHTFLKNFILVQLGACSGRILAKYLDYKKHPDLYAMQSAPWYYSILFTMMLTAVMVTLTVIAYFIVGHIIKKRNLKDNNDETV